MRRLVITLFILMAFLTRPIVASADTGCAFDACLRLAQDDNSWRERSYEWDTRPRYQQSERNFRREYRQERHSLSYYCSLGSQTPRSMRDRCRRAGYR
jgi:hypothetical protein